MCLVMCVLAKSEAIATSFRPEEKVAEPYSMAVLLRSYFTATMK